jgi:hypothetical protein
MVDLLDLDDIYEASEVSPEDLRHDADATTKTNPTQQNPSRVLPAKNFSIFDKPQPKATPTQANTSISTDPVKRVRKQSQSGLARELDKYIRLVSSGELLYRIALYYNFFCFR